MTAERIKITYATLRADNEELQAPTRPGSRRRKARLGEVHRNFVDGAGARRRRDVRGPLADRHATSSSGRSRAGTRADVQDAIAAARRAQPAWFRLGWERRLEILQRAAELISERQMEYAGLMAIEVGKTRLEALGEVEEAADLIRYYAKTAEDNAFYDHPMDNLGDAAVHTRSILRPHGVFAVISPFNFPMALAVGPSCGGDDGRQHGRVQAGVGVGDDGASRSLEAYRDAGVPDGVFNLVMGPGDTVGDELQTNPGIDGIVFTGSYEVGFELFRTFSTRYPRPCIVEMGGKNPAIVLRSPPTSRRRPRGSCARRSASAARSARPTAGSTSSGRSTTSSSGCWSRRPRSSTVGDPLPRTAFLGPVIDERAVDRHQQAVAEARRDGTVFTGGERLTDGGAGARLLRRADGRRRLPANHRLFQDELFAPFTAVARGRLARRGARARQRQRLRPDRRRLLEDQAEVQRFLDEIEAGVLYVNRRAGATTGAWPGVQAFGGWKGSGSTGKAGLSMYYVAQFLREQSHTVVD